MCKKLNSKDYKSIMEAISNGHKVAISSNKDEVLGCVYFALDPDCRELDSLEGLELVDGVYLKNGLDLVLKANKKLVLDSVEDDKTGIIIFIKPFKGKYKDYSIVVSTLDDGSVADNVWVLG